VGLLGRKKPEVATTEELEDLGLYSPEEQARHLLPSVVDRYHEATDHSHTGLHANIDVALFSYGAAWWKDGFAESDPWTIGVGEILVRIGSATRHVELKSTDTRLTKSQKSALECFCFNTVEDDEPGYVRSVESALTFALMPTDSPDTVDDFDEMALSVLPSWPSDLLLPGWPGDLRLAIMRDALRYVADEHGKGGVLIPDEETTRVLFGYGYMLYVSMEVFGRSYRDGVIERLQEG